VVRYWLQMLGTRALTVTAASRYPFQIPFTLRPSLRRSTYNKRVRQMSSPVPQRSDSPMWNKFLGKQPDYPKFSASWWWDKFVICVVFAVTGSTTMFVCRPLLKTVLQLEGTLKEGPWSYRLAYFSLITPVYSLLLVSVGTFFGRHYFFKRMALKIWARFIPPLKKYLIE